MVSEMKPEASAVVEYRLFGGLRVVRDGQPTDLGGRKQRAVLAALLLEPDRVVPVDRLTDRVWGDAVPPRVESSLQAYVSNLRRVLEPQRRRGEPPSVLVTEAGGYRMVVARDQLDVTRFEDLGASGAAALAEGDVASAAVRLDEALALWDTLLPELASETWVAAASTRLETLRADAFENAVEARLALGQHRRLIPGLERAVAAHPFRERLRGQLALALYRDGRQTEALRALADARQTLAEEIGVEPGPELRALEADILAHAPHLAPPPPATESARAGAPAGPVAAGGSGSDRFRGDDAGGREPAVGAPGAVGLVGREAELAALMETARLAVQGSGRVVVVSGEPGIGKTRLVEELVAWCQAGIPEAGAGDVQVAWARCPEGAASAPFWAYTQVADQLLGAGVLAPDAVDAVERVDRATDRSGTVDADADRFALHSAVVAALRTATRPLLLVVDDLQWADPSSLRTIEFVAGELRTMPVLLVVTVRPLDPNPPARLVACLGELARQPGSVRIDVAGLSVDDVATWVQVRGPAHPGPGPGTATASGPGDRTGSPPDAVDEIAQLVHERTGGNPFFVGEVVELLARQERLDDPRAAAAMGVPAAVHDVVRRRVSLLPAETQQLLSMASVLGGTIDVDVLAWIAGRSLAPTLQALDPAVDAGFLVEDRMALGRLRFAHALVADALVAELSPSRRAQLHAAVTEALEELRGADVDEHLPALVHHAREGAMAGTAARAFDYACRAARLAAARVAHEDAVAYWEDALRVLDLARPRDRRARYETLVELGIARHWTDDLIGSQAALLEAIGLAEALGDVEAAWSAAAALPHTTLWQQANYGEVNDELVAALERLRQSLPADESPRERAAVIGALADALYYDDDRARSDHLAQEAVAAAREAEHPPTLARALVTRYRTLWRAATAEARREVADELVQVAEGRGLPPDMACVAHFARSAIAFELGDRATFEADLARCRALAVQARSPGHISQVGWFEASWLLAQGRYDEASTRAHEMYVLHRRTRGWGADAVLASYTIAIAHDRGELDGEALREMTGLVDGEFGLAFREVVAWILTEVGQLDEARALVGPVGTVPELPDDWLRQPILNSAAYVRAALDDVEAARVVYDRLLPSAGRLDVAGTGGPLVGTVDLGLARLAATLGDEVAARRHVAAAVELLERFDARPWLARALLTQGELLARSDDGTDQARAVAALARSRALATDLGLVPVLRALDQADLEITADGAK